jgi:hypothetical protein
METQKVIRVLITQEEAKAEKDPTIAYIFRFPHANYGHNFHTNVWIYGVIYKGLGPTLIGTGLESAKHWAHGASIIKLTWEEDKRNDCLKSV